MSFTFRPLDLIGNKFVAFLTKNHNSLEKQYQDECDDKSRITFPIFCWIVFNRNYDKIDKSFVDNPNLFSFIAKATIDEVIDAYKK